MPDGVSVCGASKIPDAGFASDWFRSFGLDLTNDWFRQHPTFNERTGRRHGQKGGWRLLRARLTIKRTVSIFNWAAKDGPA